MDLREQLLTQAKYMKIKQLELFISELEYNGCSDEELAPLRDLLIQKKLGKRSKNKGSNYERKIAKILKKTFNTEFHRTPLSGGFAKSTSGSDFRGDIIPLEDGLDFKFHIECKDHKTWKLQKWLEQAKTDCPEDRIPIVIFHKYNTSEDYVSLSLPDFLEIIDIDKVMKRK